MKAAFRIPGPWGEPSLISESCDIVARDVAAFGECNRPRSALLRELFSAKRNGIDISYIGVSIGSSDMNAQPYTYDDLLPDQTDVNLKKFSLAPDEADAVLRQILSINAEIRILGWPWSRPAWMKTDDELKGGPEFHEALREISCEVHRRNRGAADHA